MLQNEEAIQTARNTQLQFGIGITLMLNAIVLKHL